MFSLSWLERPWCAVLRAGRARALGPSLILLLTVAGLALPTVAGSPAPTVAPLSIGNAVADIDSLCDIQCQHRSLHEFSGHRAVLVAFLGTDCPVAKLITPQLIRWSNQYANRDVQLIAVFPHENETIDQVAAFASDRNLPFPVFKDRQQRLAEALGVKRVPTICLFDDQWQLRYRGRVSDQYAVNQRRARATREDARLALDELLTTGTIATAETPADGCLVDRSSPTLPESAVTFYEHVLPILRGNCQSCHQPHRAAPFSLLTYDDAVRWATNIREAIQERRMPPWQADPRYGHFMNDRRLSDVEVRVVTQWVDGGMAVGDPQSQATAGPLRDTGQMTESDVVLRTEHDFDVPGDGVVPYWHDRVAAQQLTTLFDHDRWVQAAEVRPVNPEVVHHVMVFAVCPGYPGPPASLEATQVLAMWAPGEPSFVFPKGTAMRVPRGSSLVFQVHFNPNGTPLQTHVDLALKFAPGVPDWEIAMGTHENRHFRISPGDQHATCEFVFLVKQPEHTRLVGLFPHLHLRGKNFHFDVKYPDGKKERLLSVPRYDFNWQTMYWFQQPKEIPVGSFIKAVAHWDNSRHNPHNPDPQAEVRYGFQTTDEMMVSGMMFVFRPAERAVFHETERQSEIHAPGDPFSLQTASGNLPR